MTNGAIKDFKLLREQKHVFADRTEAGKVLSKLVAEEKLTSPLVLAIPAGGVPVGAALAKELRYPLDVAVVSKITLPWNSEVGYGAVAFDGSYQLNGDLVQSTGLSDNDVARGIAATREKVARRVKFLRGQFPQYVLSEHDLVLVDDGLASGFTMLVAVTALYHAGARSIVVAVPTGHINSVQRVARDVQTVCCANICSGSSFAVASAYHKWSDVSEVQALQILESVQ